MSSTKIIESIEAVQRAAIPSTKILQSIEAMQAAMPSTKIIEAIEAMQQAAMPSKKILESIDAMQRVTIPSPKILESVRAIQSLLPSISPAASQFFLASSRGLHTDPERQLRALRNAAVHGSPAEPSTEVEPPPPKTASEERVRKMAPPGASPNSREAIRVLRAALEHQQTDVIVLSADIRHSTNLMNEAFDQYVFASTLEAFIASSRQVVGRNRGWFANFTGDGFLAFWPTTNGTRNANVKRALVTVSQLFEEFENVHIPRFTANAWSYREDTGLGIGLDHGEVAVVEVGEEATIVGRPVVGATRLVSAAFEWEVLANNHLGVYVTSQIETGELPGINAEMVVVPTKDSETVRAYSIEYEWTQRPLHARR